MAVVVLHVRTLSIGPLSMSPDPPTTIKAAQKPRARHSQSVLQ